MGMSLCDMVLFYMHYVSLNEYMMKIIDMNGVVLMCYVEV